jgi:RNA polymerase sigma-70 factor (ECF subfamily)
MKETLARELAGHVSRMHRVALRIVGSSDAAQEIVQEACLRALRGVEKFDGRAALATWLHRITVNCAYDHLRKGRRQRGRTDWNSGAAGMFAMLDAGPAEHAEKNDLYRLALRLVAALPEDCRSAFMLTQLDGYTYDEAAAIENLSRGTVASRVYRARQLLIEQMNPHRAGEMP